MLRIRLLIPLSALLCGLVVAGCGGPDRASYEQDLAEVGRVVDRALAAMPQDATTETGPEQVNTLAGELREAADQLDDLDPPDNAAAPQRRLERGLRGVADAFEDLAVDLTQAETDEAKAELFVAFATNEQIDRAFEDLAGAQEAYAREGYRVFRAPVAAPEK